MSVVQRTSRPSSPADRGELVGTIAGAVLVVPLLAAMGYGAWMLVRLVVGS